MKTSNKKDLVPGKLYTYHEILPDIDGNKEDHNKGLVWFAADGTFFDAAQPHANRRVAGAPYADYWVEQPGSFNHELANMEPTRC